MVKLLKSRWWNATFLPFPSLPQSSLLLFPSLPRIPLRSRPAHFQLVVLGERCNLLPAGSGASPSRNSIGAFKPYNLTPGGNNFNDFPQMVTERHYHNFRWWNGNFTWWNARHGGETPFWLNLTTAPRSFTFRNRGQRIVVVMWDTYISHAMRLSSVWPINFQNPGCSYRLHTCKGCQNGGAFRNTSNI